jgi:hypothetical protein
LFPPEHYHEYPVNPGTGKERVTVDIAGSKARMLAYSRSYLDTPAKRAATRRCALDIRNCRMFVEKRKVVTSSSTDHYRRLKRVYKIKKYLKSCLGRDLAGGRVNLDYIVQSLDKNRLAVVVGDLCNAEYVIDQDQDHNKNNNNNMKTGGGENALKEEIGESLPDVRGSQLGKHVVLGFCLFKKLSGKNVPTKLAPRDQSSKGIINKIYKNAKVEYLFGTDLSLVYVSAICSSFKYGKWILDSLEEILRDKYDGFALKSVQKAYDFYAHCGFRIHDLATSTTYPFKRKRGSPGNRAKTHQRYQRYQPYPVFAMDEATGTYFLVKPFRRQT